MFLLTLQIVTLLRIFVKEPSHWGFYLVLNIVLWTQRDMYDFVMKNKKETTCFPKHVSDEIKPFSAKHGSFVGSDIDIEKRFCNANINIKRFEGLDPVRREYKHRAHSWHDISRTHLLKKRSHSHNLDPNYHVQRVTKPYHGFSFQHHIFHWVRFCLICCLSSSIIWIQENRTRNMIR